MSFAIGAIIIIYLLLPGAVSIRAYYSSLRAKSSANYVPFNELLFTGILITAVIHSFAICIVRLLGYEVQFDFLYKVLSIETFKNFQFTNKEFTHNFLCFQTYVLFTTLIPYCLVKLSKYYIHKFSLDYRFNFLNNCNHWFKLFHKKYISNFGNKNIDDIDVLYVDVFLLPDIIYSGVLIDFNYSPRKDELENIVLNFAKRRKVNEIEIKDIEGKPGTGKTIQVSPAVSIPGEILVLPMKNAININIKYIKLEITEE